ncbi:hypothetical protein DENSPDRAFT_259560 [Dentipellis sp. KUC8613]|nr:hypothetical protein DENSPDRAFT_259560 [Dentipellis sp. KUC8613]
MILNEIPIQMSNFGSRQDCLAPNRPEQESLPNAPPPKSQGHAPTRTPEHPADKRSSLFPEHRPSSPTTVGCPKDDPDQRPTRDARALTAASSPSAHRFTGLLRLGPWVRVQPAVLAPTSLKRRACPQSSVPDERRVRRNIITRVYL